MGKPEIRFKGYTDEWEQRKLGEYVSITSGEAPSKFEVGTELYVKVDDLNYNDKYVVDTQNKVAEHSTIKRVTKGSVIFPKRGAAIMTNKVRILGIDSYMDTNMMSLSSEKLDSEFLYNIISKEGLYKIADTSTIPQINNKHIEPYEVIIPSLDEQKRIGVYFRSLDHLITLHQRKCDEVKSLKKYMLQKMFPQNEQKVPEIRFEGFTEAWEQRKLGDVAQEFKSGNSLKADEIDITGDYPVYGGNGLRGYTSTYNHDGEYALIGRQGALCGNMNYSAGKAYFTEHAVVVKADENNVTRFLYYMLNIMNLGQYSDQSAQPGLAVNKLVKLENSFPKKEEQQQIGAYFRSLDHLITLHQQKCEELKKIKKFMLQKMFV